MPIQEVLPDLLLPEVSRLLLHPGWLVGTQVKEREIKIEPELSPESVDKKLVGQGISLHELRKATKRIRYQMEVFQDFYGETYEEYLNQMKDIQGVLGQIQDRFVLSEFLTDALHAKSKKSLPTLANQLTKESKLYSNATWILKWEKAFT